MSSPREQAMLCVVILALFASTQVKIASGAQISVHPDTFIEAVTELVYISCSPDGTSARAKEILLMEIAKDGEKPITNVRPNAKPSYGNGITNRFQAQGVIDKDVSRSYLNLTLLYPSGEDAGTYTCVMSYLNEEGLLQQDKAAGKLIVDKQNSTKTEDRIVTLETALNNLLTRVKTLEKENSQLQKDTRNQTKQLDVLTEKVSFSTGFSAAVREATSLINGQVVVFSDVIFQQGQGYNATSGVFTAPRAGVYVFHLVLEIGSGDTVGEVSLMAGTKELARLYTQDKDYGDQSSVTSIIDLQPGAEVKAVVMSAAGANPKVLADKLCVFSGHLIKTL